ncbi:MAG: histidine kinase, partial [Catalinimonas sp.]
MYKDRSRVKKAMVVVALVIGGLSLLYTNYLVGILAQRERKMVSLYAKAIENLANDVDLNQDVTLAYEIIASNRSIPVILTDSLRNPESSTNLTLRGRTDAERIQQMREEMVEMAAVYEPILIEPVTGVRQYVYYRNSRLTDMLRYYPYVQLTVITIFALLAYIAFSYSRRAEQNRVWVGLAKETAHQLGTPLSSLMAWLEYFRSDDRLRDDPVIDELAKDVQRLEMITARFSHIGSAPALRPESVGGTVANAIDYLRPRISRKVDMEVVDRVPADVRVALNRPLFE